jgi:hypothetical protein
MCFSSLQSVSVHLPRSVAISEHAKQVIFLLLACPVFGHPPPDTVIFFISGSALTRGRNKDKLCESELTERDTRIHGGDRFCSNCRAEPHIKELLDNEIETQCETIECDSYRFVLKEKSEPQVYGDSRFCKGCLQNWTILDKLAAEQKEGEQNEGSEVGQTEEKQEEEGEEQQEQEQELQTKGLERFDHGDIARLHENLGKPKQLKTTGMKEFLNSHARYLIETFLSLDPIELSRILTWAMDEQLFCETPKNWTTMNETILTAELIKLKQKLINSVKQTITDKIPISGKNAVQGKKIIQDLIPDACTIPHAAIQLVQSHIEEARLRENPLTQFM